MADECLSLLRAICADVRRGPSGEAEWGDSWLALHYLCPSAAAGAAEILDKKTVTRVVAKQSGREFYVVEGNTRGKTHTCLPGFCTCTSFCISVASKPEALVCKHELAVLLADALGLTLQRELEDVDWAREYGLALTLPLMQYDAEMAAAPPLAGQ